MGKIGQMTRRIEFKKPVTTKSSLGAPVKSYTHVCYAWSSRMEMNDSPEQYINNRLVVAKRWKYTLHHNDDIDETMIINDDEVNYNILSINRDDSLFMTIVAEKIIE